MPPVTKSKGAWSPAKSVSRPAEKTPSRPAARPSPGGGRRGAPEGPGWRTPDRPTGPPGFERVRGGVERRERPQELEAISAPARRAPSGAGYTPRREVMPPGVGRGIAPTESRPTESRVTAPSPDYVMRRRAAAPPGAEERTPEEEERLQGALGALGWLGAGALPIVGPALHAIGAAREAIERPEQVSERLRSPLARYTVTPGLERLMQIPQNLRKPVTADEAAVAGVRTAQANRAGINLAGGEPVIRQAQGEQPDIGSMIRRVPGEIAGAGFGLLGEPFMQTTGRGWGAVRDITGQQEQKLEEFIAQKGAPPAEADRWRQMQRSGQTANIPGFGAFAPVTSAQVGDALAWGRETFEALPPLEQLVVGLIGDPLNLVTPGLQSARFSRGAASAYRHAVLASPESIDDVARLVQSGRAFPQGWLATQLDRVPLVRQIIQRTPEARGVLAGETALDHLSGVLAVANSADEQAELMRAFALVAQGKEAEALAIAGKYGLGSRVVSVEEAARLGRLGGQAGEAISPLTSRAGKITSLVMNDMVGTPRQRNQVAKLLAQAAAGRGPTPAPEAVRLSGQAEKKLLEMFVRSSGKVAGVAEPGWIGKAQKAWFEYQGLHAQYFQIGPNFGVAVRNAMASVTEGLMDGVLYPGFNKRWFEKTWRGMPVGGMRGRGAGFEQLSGLPRLLQKGGEVGRAVGRAIDLPRRFAEASEDIFARMAIRKGIDHVFETAWRWDKVVPQEEITRLMALENTGDIAPGTVDKLMGAVQSAWHPLDIEDQYQLLRGGDGWRVLTAARVDALRKAGVDPAELQKILRTSQRPDEFKAAVRAYELRLREQAAGYKPTLPSQDAALEVARRELLDAGMPPQQVEAEVARAFAQNAADREPEELAAIMLRDSIEALDTQQKEVWIRRYEEWRQAQGRLTTETVGHYKALQIQRRTGDIPAGEADQMIDDLWKKYWRDRTEADHALREEIEQATGQTLVADDVARELAPTPPVPPDLMPNGQGAPIDPVVVARARLPRQAAAVRQAAREIMLDWGRASNFSREGQAAVEAVLKLAKGRLAETRIVGERFGTGLRDAAYFNYGDRRNFDTLLRMVYSYPYWYSREAAATARRTFTNPHAVWMLQNLHEQTEKINQDMPDWMKANLNVEMGSGGLLSIPIFANLDPTYSFWRPDFHDPEIMKSETGRFFSTLQDYGPGSLHTGIPQILGALAASQGDDDLALSYAGYLGPWTKALREGTGLAVESLLPGQYRLMSVRGPAGNVFVGTKWDQRKIGVQIQRMVAAGELPPEVAKQIKVLLDHPFDRRLVDDPQYAAAWAVFLKAVEMQRLQAVAPTLSSWLGGPAFRFRTETEVQILEGQQKYQGIIAQRGQVSADEYRALQRDFWREPGNQALSMYNFWNRKGTALDEAYAWDVLTRLPPSRTGTAYREAAGMNEELLSEFYEAGGIPPDWTATERDAFSQAIIVLGAAVEAPDLATVKEWEAARRERSRLYAGRAGAPMPQREGGNLIPPVTGLYAEFPQATVESFELYKFGRGSVPDRKAFLEAHPDVQAMLDRESELVTANPLVASYYATDAILRNKLYSDFYAEQGEAKQTYDRWRALSALGETDENARELAKEFYSDNKEAIKGYQADRKEFYASLDEGLGELKAGLPDIEIPSLYGLGADSVFARALKEVEQRQQAEEQAQVAAQELEGEVVSDVDQWAIEQVEQARGRIEAEQAARDANTSYFDKKIEGGLSGRDTYEQTLNAHFQGTTEFRDNPELAQAAFETVTGDWADARPNANFQAYLGEYDDIRQALLFDTTNRWTGVVAALRGMPEEQVDRSVPGLWPAWLQGQQWDGISEAARADIAGAKVTFNIDGTVSVTRQSAKAYFAGVGAGAATGGGGAGGGGRRPSVPAVGGDVSMVDVRRGEAPPGFDWNKYYGGEGRDIPGYPRRGIPYQGQYGRQFGRGHLPYGGGYGGGGGGGGNVARAAREFEGFLRDLEPVMQQALVGVLEAITPQTTPEQLAAMLQSNAALYQMIQGLGPGGLGVLLANFQAWRGLGRAIAPPGEGGAYSGSAARPMIYRVYPPRGEESGL